VPPTEVGPINAHVTDDGWQWYSVEDAARMLGISTPTVRRRISAGAPSWTLHDGSTVPVIAEQLKRPQGSYFQVKLPAALEGASTEDPKPPLNLPLPQHNLTEPDTSPPDWQPSDSDQQASVTPPPVDHHTSETDQHASDVSVEVSGGVVPQLVAQLVERSEMIGALRAKLERSETDLDASRRETARVTAEATTTRVELEAAVRYAENRRLVAEAALLALETRQASEPAPTPSTQSWWRWLIGPW
jgi:hypothetical protein